MNVSKLDDLLFALEAPLGWDETYLNDKDKQQIFLELLTEDLEFYFEKTKINFTDVLVTLLLV